MKKVLFLFIFTLSAQQCFGGKQPDIFSSVPSWIKINDSIHEDFKWISFNQQKAFFYSPSSEGGGTLRIPENKSRIALLFYKEEDQRFGEVPTTNDKYKDFVLPLPDDFNSFNRSLLRLRPSLLFNNSWKMTIPRVKINDGNLEGRILFRKDGNFF